MWSVRKLTVLFVLVAALCGSGTAIADAPYVTVQNANVREQADVNSMRVITFPKGTRVDVTFKEGDWYAVSRDGIHFGYIWSELLAPEDQGSLNLSIGGRYLHYAETPCHHALFDGLRSACFGGRHRECQRTLCGGSPTPPIGGRYD